MTEVWKDIEGYEGLYQISNLGRVKSLDRVITYKDGRKRKFYSKVLKPLPDKDGYFHVNLLKNRKCAHPTIHGLVAKRFIGERPEGYVINHIDENKANNEASNLEYVTQKENVNHGTRTERMRRTRGKPVLGISTKDGSAIAFDSPSEAERVNGFDHRRISACALCKRKQHKGYVWKYI